MFGSNENPLHPFEALLLADCGEVMCVDREADERAPRLELHIKPTHRRVVPELYVNGRVLRRSPSVLYVPREL